VIHDGSDEVETAFAVFGEKNSPRANGNLNSPVFKAGTSCFGMGTDVGRVFADYRDTGTASRFFYCAKANKADRAGSTHPTVKPQALLRYLAKLVTPSGGMILDPFAGSGSMGQAAWAEGFSAILIEQDQNYVADIHQRMQALKLKPVPPQPRGGLPLFEESAA
jgi:site-specific DNA-methyltransferase (adenine-specific)